MAIPRSPSSPSRPEEIVVSERDPVGNAPEEEREEDMEKDGREALLGAEIHAESDAAQASGGLPQDGSNARAVVLTVIACMGAFLFGFHLGFSSPAYDDVRIDADLTSSQADLVFSIVAVGAMGGALLAGKVADRVGRKPALMLAAVPLAGGSVLFVSWVTFSGLLIARLITGFGVGFSSVMVPLYIAETAPTELRGTLGTVNQLILAGGILAVNVAGLPTLHHPHYWKLLMLVGGVTPAVILFVGILAVGVETPSWLVSRGRRGDALDSLRALRGRRSARAEAELEALVREDEEQGTRSAGLLEQLGRLGRKENARPFAVAVMVTLTQQWCGINAVVFNTKLLFEGDDPKKDAEGRVKTSVAQAALVGAILANVVQVLFTGLSAAFSEKRGRRFFLLASAGGITVANAALGVAYKADAAEGIKVVLVGAYYALFAIGLGPVTWLLASEIFPAETRGLLVSATTLINWLSAFLVTLTFSDTNDAFGSSGTFFLYCVFSLVGSLCIFLFVPETKGRSLEDVSHLFRGGWRWRGAAAADAAAVANNEYGSV